MIEGYGSAQKHTDPPDPHSATQLSSKVFSRIRIHPYRYFVRRTQILAFDIRTIHILPCSLRLLPSWSWKQKCWSKNIRPCYHNRVCFIRLINSVFFMSRIWSRIWYLLLKISAVLWIGSSARCSLLRDEDFSCSLDVLYGGQRISKLQFLIKKI